MFSFTKTDLRNHVGSQSYERGRRYFEEDRVLQAKIEDDVIIGEIEGNELYRATLSFEKNGRLKSDCSCPIGGECKHVVALGLAVLAQQPSATNDSDVVDDALCITSSRAQISDRELEELDVLQQFAASGTSSKILQEFAKRLGISTSNSLSRATPPPPTWEREMRQMLSRVTDTTAAVTPRSVRLILDCKPVQYCHQTKYELVIRPAWYDSVKQKYVFDGISWRTIASSDQDQIVGLSGPVHRFLRGIYLTFATYYYEMSTHLTIGDAAASEWWNIVAQCSDLGIELVYKDSRAFTVEQSVVLALALDDVQKHEAISLVPSVTLFDYELTQDEVTLIGGPRFSIALVRREVGPRGNYQMTIHPVEGATDRAFFVNPRPLMIPAADIAKFERDYAPRLVRHARIRNQSARVRLPDRQKPILSLEIKKSGETGILLVPTARYGEMIVAISQPGDIVQTTNGAVIIRDHAAEHIFQATLTPLVTPHLSENLARDFANSTVVLKGVSAARFVAEVVPRVQAALIDVVLDSTLPAFVAETATPEVSFSVEEKDDEPDWFNLNIMTTVGGTKIPFTDLFTALANHETHVLLPNGHYVALEQPAFTRLKQLIDEARKTRELTKTGLSLSAFQTGFWEELQQLGIVEKQARRWQELSSALSTTAGVTPVPVPATLAATLRPYQHEGFSWLAFLHAHRLGGVLADDMGLGKTVQTIALILHTKAIAKKKDRKPFLVVAPTSVVENWDREIAHFAPTLTKVVLRKGDRSSAHAQLATADVVITSYALLHRDFAELDRSYAAVILDEAQFVKNYQSKAYSLIRKLKADSKIALTGTPMENNLMELWSIFSLVAPGLFPFPEHFAELYRRPIEKAQDTVALTRLRARIRPFILRRKKELVAKELPPKTEQTLMLTLADDHRHIYDVHLQRERQKVLGLLASGGMKEHRFEILRSLTILRQLCLHPGLVDEKYADTTATKLVALEEQLETIVAEGHKVLVFSQFTSFLAEVKKVLEAKQWKYLSLDGRTKNRGVLLDTFQNGGDEQIFLISLKAGGFGLNLTAADYCILLDPWWNPAAESQAVDRTHRIGQQKHVFVYRMIAKDTIEEKVVKLQERKKKLFSNVLEDGDVFASLVTEDEIRSIFE